MHVTGHEDFEGGKTIQMVMKKGSSPQPVDLYGALVAHCGAMIMSAQAEEIEIIESILLDNTLQPNPWPALLAADLWVLLAR